MSEPPTPLAAFTALGVLVSPAVAEPPDDPAPRAGASVELEQPKQGQAQTKRHHRGTIDELRHRVARPPGLR
ncbi:MAG TPA: hypothetical protein VFU02_18130 [Polyangiaceae bacterium]|nr:hypothetical protein [Polyangiaceae bacterium]